tara:strand:+ start:119 stop:370 length:252 start_codon:yes stop_codon:yes gene_type:complete
MPTRIGDTSLITDGISIDLKSKDDKMPTSNDEARKIVSIMSEYLSDSDAQSITRRLDEEVGQASDNDSLKVSLQMLRALYEDR